MVTRNAVSGIVAVAAFAALGGVCWLSYRAGLAGDVKTGACGDPVAALRIERQAFYLNLVFGALLATLLYRVRVRFQSIRIVIAIFGLVAGLLLGVFAGCEAESAGVAACWDQPHRLVPGRGR